MTKRVKSLSVFLFFVKSDSTPQSFAFYPFRSLEGNIREYQCLVDLLEGRVEEREELDIY